MAGDDTIHYQDHYWKLIGNSQRAYFISTPDGTMCVPLTDSGMIIFIVEPSPAFGQDVLMLPGGGVEPGESSEECANRELQEEIGYKSLRLDYLGELHPWEKYLDLRAFLYLARDLIPSKLHGDEIYNITTRLVPLDDFERLIQTGELRDSTVIAALYLARKFLAEHSEQIKDDAAD